MASLAWSNAGCFRCVVASTRTKSFPPVPDRRYQKRFVSSIQVGAAATPTVRPSRRWRTGNASVKLGSGVVHGNAYAQMADEPLLPHTGEGAGAAGRHVSMGTTWMSLGDLK